VKKAVLRDEIGRLTSETYRLERELATERAVGKKLAEEVEHLKAHWRPVPMTHEWQPRNPQCALCDDPRDSPRHRPPGQMRVAWVPQLPTPPGLPSVLGEVERP
jgi:hypothetical protein